MDRKEDSKLCMRGNVKLLLNKVDELEEIFDKTGELSIKNLYSLNARLMETIRAVEYYDIFNKE